MLGSPSRGPFHHNEARRTHSSVLAIMRFPLVIILICFSAAKITDSQDDATSDPLSGRSGGANLNLNEKIDTLRSGQALELIKGWASRFGRDIHYGTHETTCIRSIKEQFNPSRRAEYKSSVVSIDWTQMHNEIVKTISNSMEWHKRAVESISRASENLAEKHNYNNSANFRYNYVDVHRLHSLEDEQALYNQLQENSQPASDSKTGDESANGGEHPPADSTTYDDTAGQPDGSKSSGETGGEPQPEQLPKPSMLQSAQQQQSDNGGSQTEWETPVRYLNLVKHKNFGDVPIDTEESAVHVPVHIFPGDTTVMNGIAWSDGLTKVFKDNFVRNPKLTNQYFASQSGFLRLYPAQPWQIPKAQPDLYDGRMRPWYVAGASSRKDVIILVDSSGSMTGSRRDIARGVVFEILDTLTDNDHFLILKFADSIQQVGVPGCPGMRVERKPPNIPQKNTLPLYQPANEFGPENNKTDLDSLYLLPATGRNVRHIKTNFTISTSGIANFSNALVTAFEVLGNYQRSGHGSECNQAIMLITDGSPSDFEDIFNRYNYPNAPVRVFTYLIGREAGDVTHTKMMACHNRGYYTHVINLAEVRETVQQYIPVMARPLVLNGIHPITWTPAYGELTYQILTDWIWESKRRDKARAILATNKRGSPSNTEYVPNIKISNSDGSSYSDEDEPPAADGSEFESVDLFGYEANPDCFWEMNSNDLLTTVVQPVFDRKNESVVTEKFLVKNVWTVKETVMRTAQILGVAAADMKINDIISLAPSHKLGANGYAVMLTNNGYAMHHPDLRSILEPFSTDPSEKNMRILKPFFSSLDFTQVEHILVPSADKNIVALRNEAVLGLTGWRELPTKRTLDCQKRVQTRRQNFYYKQIDNFPFSFMIAIPQPYGSHKVEAQVKLKSLTLPEKLTTYFTTSDYEIWTVHPQYQYCYGPSNHTVSTLLDMLQRIVAGKLEDIEWLPAESSSPPVFFPGKIFCDKDLVQSLVFDAVATFMFSDSCGPPSPNAE